MTRFCGIFVWALAVGLAGCSTTKRVVTSSDSRPLPAAGPSSSVLVLEPLVQYEDMATKARVGPNRPSEVQVRQDLFDVGIEALRARGYTVTAARPDAGLPEAGLRLAARISERIDQLTRAMIPPEDLANLRELGGGGVFQAVLALHVRVKIGPRGYWDPNSGIIGPEVENATLRAALLNADTGAALWQNSVFLRDSPRVGSPAYRRTLESLFPVAPSAEPQP